MLILYGAVLFTELRHIFTSGNAAFQLPQPNSPKAPVRPPGGVVSHPPIGPGMFWALFFDINRKHNPLRRARGHRGGPGYRPNIGKCSLFPALTTQKRPFGDLEGWYRTPYMGQEFFWYFFHPNREHKPLRSAQGREGRALWPPHFRPKRARWAARAPPVARLFTASSRF